MSLHRIATLNNVTSINAVYAVLTGLRAGDLISSTRGTSVLVTRCGGTKQCDVVLAHPETGDRTVVATKRFAQACLGRVVTFDRPENAVVPADPAVADRKHLKALIAELAAMGDKRVKGKAALLRNIEELQNRLANI